MDDELFYDRYADVILFSALRLRKDDCLSINTEERDYRLARLIAGKAKRITGNGSYIQLLENGRIVGNFDLFSDFPLEKKPTCLIYLSYYRKKEEADLTGIYEPRKLQMFSLLSDPVDSSSPLLPSIKCLLPSALWDEELGALDWERKSMDILSSMMNLESRDFLRLNDIRNDNLVYLARRLDSMKLTKARIATDEGTDMTFSFRKGSHFVPSFSSTVSGRFYSPSVYSADIFRLIDWRSVTGWMNTTRPFVLWGKKRENLSLHFTEGSLDDMSSDRVTRELFDLYSRQDANALRPVMLSLSESNHPLSGEELTYISDIDRMRTSSLTLGGARAEAVPQELKDSVDESIVTLTLPVGSSSMVLTALNEEGDEVTVFSDGSINVEE